MNRHVVITAALTGAADSVSKSPHVPVTPQQIADDAIAAARAGAAVVHVHVRHPETGIRSRDVALYRKAAGLIRAADVDVVLNLTAGMGGDLVVDEEDPLKPVDGTDLVSQHDRMPHVEELRPDIATLDCGSYNFGDGQALYVSTTAMLRAGAKRFQELGVKPELEVFDTGQLWFAQVLHEEGLVDDPPLVQLCMGVPYGAPAHSGLLQTMVEMLPADAQFTSFALGRDQLPWVAQSVLLGGHARVGLEDNLYLARGVKATNAQLVERAVTIVESLGAEVATADQAREIFGLRSAR
ncbi:3-keto-5-aminohexanoate cleavage protein [Actinomycetospora sp. CA-101289]|uniref:3-keto-5-aminohexanoate cleavage protein n=1 Tax=Actinomycetospora sp. CA-101289 TaxID=3239893 RepID=UPI003D97C856